MILVSIDAAMQLMDDRRCGDYLMLVAVVMV
jgi:hypothetical protein